MVNEFSKGGAYTEVNYGQYVIIDTILNENHRNDSANGILYRRGFDYNQEVAGERPDRNSDEFYDIEYGTETIIVWVDETESVEDPETGEIHYVPIIDQDGNPVQRQEEQVIQIITGEKFNNDKWAAAWRNYITNPGAGAIYVGQIVGPEGNSPQLQAASWSDIEEHNGAIINEEVEINNNANIGILNEYNNTNPMQNRIEEVQARFEEKIKDLNMQCWQTKFEEGIKNNAQSQDYLYGTIQIGNNGKKSFTFN